MDIAEIEPLDVLCVKAAGGLAGLGKAWEDLESKLPTLKKRKFYGAFYPSDESYLACVVVSPEDPADGYGFERRSIPGGRCARRKMLDWRSDPGRVISEAFDAMSQKAERDRSRPALEYYRSENEVVLLMPVR